MPLRNEDNRLYVVGEESGSPKTWSAWSEYRLVLASSAEEALGFADAWHEPVAEVDMTPGVIVYMHSPNWGDDE